MRDSMKNQMEMAEKALKTLQELCRLREEMEEMSKENEDESDNATIMKELKKDYDSFFKWALDATEYKKIDGEEAKNKWKELHPNLPLPRVFLVEKENMGSGFTLLFIMDAYPMYLAYTNKPNPVACSCK